MGWKKGPLPPDTWMWGAVVPTDHDGSGFFFADFHGNAVTMSPGTKYARTLKPEEVAWYNNALDLPPTGAKSRVGS
jgi:hypothetical protein